MVSSTHGEHCPSPPVASNGARAVESPALQTRLRQFTSDRSGNIAMLFGLMALSMTIIIGSAIDLGRWLHARGITVAALDSAVLAAGRMLQVNALDETAALAAAERFYKDNTSQRPQLLSDTIEFITADGGTAITAQGAAFIETIFIKLVGINKLPLLKLTGSEFSKAVLAVGGNAEESVEISMMLDVSGSMSSGTKFQDMKLAAKDLVNIVVYANQGTYYSKVGIVPFSSYVRPPASMLAAVRGGGTFGSQSPTMLSGSLITHRATPCVAERVGTEKYTDAVPAANQYLLPSYWSSSTCEMSATSEIVPLSNNKDDLIARIDALTMSGSTAGHLGTAWAWYLLSPNWSPVMPVGSGAGAYGNDKLKKIAILMTDGEYNTQYCSTGSYRGVRDKNSYGYAHQRGNCTAANGKSADQAVALCAGMKAKGITVYTIGFDIGGNAAAVNTLSACATDPTKFYNAASGEQLRQAFRDIAVKISNLYLSR